MPVYRPGQDGGRAGHRGSQRRADIFRRVPDRPGTGRRRRLPVRDRDRLPAPDQRSRRDDRGQHPDDGQALAVRHRQRDAERPAAPAARGVRHAAGGGALLLAEQCSRRAEPDQRVPAERGHRGAAALGARRADGHPGHRRRVRDALCGTGRAPGLRRPPPGTGGRARRAVPALAFRNPSGRLRVGSLPGGRLRGAGQRGHQRQGEPGPDVHHPRRGHQRPRRHGWARAPDAARGQPGRADRGGGSVRRHPGRPAVHAWRRAGP